VPISIRLQGIGHADGALESHDPRFGTARSVAAPEWWDLNTQVAAFVRDLYERDDPPAVYLSGNTFLVNTNSVGLVAELESWNAELRVPDTLVGPEQWELDARPHVEEGPTGERERVLIFALHERDLFTPDLEVGGFYERALETGWSAVAEFPMPLDGQVVILRHEDWLGET
jgi:hypothetical protein